MPFESKKQERFMWAKHPDIAKRWAKKYGSKLAKHYAAVKAKHADVDTEAAKEGKEHPWMPKIEAQQVAEDHMAKMRAKHGVKKMRSMLGRHWGMAKAKHSGLAQIPTDYKKHLEGGMHGYPPKAVAHHGRIGMKEYAELRVAFQKQGTWRSVQGVEHFYPWDVIAEGAGTFEDQPYYCNHNEISGAEMGLVTGTYTENIEGEDWACAIVHVPETKFTRDYLDRVETGLVRYVSTTHAFKYASDERRTVKEIHGESISSVTTPEIDGARILSVKRHIMDPAHIKEMRGALARAYKQAKGG